MAKLDPRSLLFRLGIVAIIVMIGFSIYAVRGHSFSDKCTPHDRDTNNCVPAGRCTPLGDSQEAAVDCPLKNYDHKFHQGL